MFEGCHYDGEDMLSNLCYISKHMAEYQTKLHGMQSDADQEIGDTMHYLEFTPRADKMLNASQMLQERRRKRREITDEIEKMTLICDAFLDGNFETKVQQAIGKMERMKSRSIPLAN